MKVQHSRLLDILYEKKIFIIPRYQRRYSWTKEKGCEQLYEDLEHIIDNKVEQYFFGSIVSIHDAKAKTAKRQEYTIIDGQQRITTILIILLIICQQVENSKGKLKVQEEVEPEVIRKNLLEDDKLSGQIGQDKKLKLKPTREDAEAFNKLFLNNMDNRKTEGSQVWVNYNYFNQKIKDSLKDSKHFLDALYKAMDALHVVNIDLEEGVDDPNIIFETLNAKGLLLTEADKIRNFVLMDMNTDDADNWYDNYWVQIEENTKYKKQAQKRGTGSGEMEIEYKTSLFIRHYLIYKSEQVTNDSRIYWVFKQYYEKKNNKQEEVLKDLKRLSEYYKYIHPDLIQGKKIDKTKTKIDKEILGCLKDLSILNTTMYCPFLLKVFDDYEAKVLEKQMVRAILKISLSYILRRKVCRMDGKGLGFPNLLTSLKKLSHNKLFQKEDYLGCIDHELKNWKDTKRFPKDREFEQAFLEKMIQTANKDFVMYLLSQIEESMDPDKIKTINFENTQIEHIMPQTLNKEWRKDLGKNWESLHGKYLNCLGNLTLIHKDDNKSIGNSSFKKKKESLYWHSALKLNESLKQNEQWDMDSIQARGRELSKKAVLIWPF